MRHFVSGRLVSGWRALMLALAMLLPAAAGAVQPDEVLDDPALETRARALSAELRCLVCQNQSIDDSDADLARDLRLLVRERLVEGDSDEQVLDYVVARYGEFVLLRPVIGWHTALLWVAAPVLLIVGGATIVIAARRRRGAGPDGPVALTEEEEAALRELERDGRP